MVLANTRDGKTQSFDLKHEGQLNALQRLLSEGQVTALSLLQNGVQQSLPRPRLFKHKSVVYGAEQVRDRSGSVIGERIFVHVGSVRASLTASYVSKMVRCDLVNLGIMTYNGNRVGQ